MAYTTINKGSSYFNTKLYTGTGASNSVTGIGFQPDWVWIKGRSGATDHGIYDAVRGVQKQIESNTTTAETTETTGLTAFGTDGFTVGALAQLNTSSATYVAWNWLASNTTTSNTSGTISSTVAANQTAGFSIVSYTGNGTAGATVGHGLGVTPKMVIIKNRSATTAWPVFTSMITTQSSGSVFTSTIFNIGDKSGGALSLNLTHAGISYGMDAQTNGSGANYIAYCFAEIKGFSKFGSYTGNGSANGPFVYTGFRPAWLMVKRSDNAQNWFMWDSKRLGYNNVNYLIFSDANSAEYTGSETSIDILSNGFKIRADSTAPGSNANGGTYIYMAFAENPFVTSGGIPVTAR
jgi:hypothetical protein